MITQIGTVPVRISFPFAALIVFMLIFCREDVVMMSLLSSFIHESGHLAFMLFFGEKPKEIVLGIFGMRIDRQGTESVSYKKEIFISLGGIIFNLIFSSVCFILFLVTQDRRFYFLVFVNVLIVFINSLPSGILDTGRALRCFLLMRLNEEKSEKVFSVISYLSVIFVTVFTLCYTAFCSVNISLIAITLYLYTVTILKKWS